MMTLGSDSLCVCGVIKDVVTGTTMIGFSGPISCGHQIVSMMPVGPGNGDSDVGNLFKQFPIESGAEQDTICMDEQGLLG